MISQRMNKEDIDPLDFENIEPTVRVGNIYKDLYSQATCLKIDMEKTKDEICEAVRKIRFEVGYDSVNLSMDAICNYLDNQLNIMDYDADIIVNPEYALSIKSEVFALNCISKGLLSILLLSDKLDKIIKEIELTKHYILL